MHREAHKERLSQLVESNPCPAGGSSESSSEATTQLPNQKRSNRTDEIDGGSMKFQSAYRVPAGLMFSLVAAVSIAQDVNIDNDQSANINPHKTYTSEFSQRNNQLQG